MVHAFLFEALNFVLNLASHILIRIVRCVGFVLVLHHIFGVLIMLLVHSALSFMVILIISHILLLRILIVLLAHFHMLNILVWIVRLCIWVIPILNILMTSNF